MVSFPTHVLLRKNEFLSETGSSYMQCVLGGWVQFEKKGSVFQELDSNLAQKDYPVDQYPAAQLICSQTVLLSAVSAVSDLLTSKLSCTPLELLVCKQNWASMEKSWIKRDRFVLNWKKRRFGVNSAGAKDKGPSYQTQESSMLYNSEDNFLICTTCQRWSHLIYFSKVWSALAGGVDLNNEDPATGQTAIILLWCVCSDDGSYKFLIKIWFQLYYMQWDAEDTKMLLSRPENFQTIFYFLLTGKTVLVELVKLA